MSEIQNASVFSLDTVSDDDFSNLIDGTITDFDEGDLVKGTVVKIERDEVLLDIGFKSEGVIPARELSIRKDVNPSDLVALGDEIEALVLQKEDKDGRLVLSKRRAEYECAWSRIEKKFNAGENVQGEVIEVVKGGLILDIGLHGFLPASLVDLRRVKDLSVYLNTTVEARVIEMDRNRNNVVLSRRVVLEEARKAERSEILGKLQPGMKLKGTVSSVVDFGAFVDLGGIDGLVHISELSWNHVNHPSEVVKVGQEIEVQVLDVDTSRERISLGLKQTIEDPWRVLVKRYPVNAIMESQITKLVPFGAFVDLGDGIEGLVHISEMARQHVEAPAQVCKVGDKVHVKVMEIDLDRRRISLSMKAAAETLGIEVPVEPLPGAPSSDKSDETSDDASAAGAAASGEGGDASSEESGSDAEKTTAAEASQDAADGAAASEETSKADEKQAESSGEQSAEKEADAGEEADKTSDSETSTEQSEDGAAEDKAQDTEPADAESAEESSASTGDAAEEDASDKAADKDASDKAAEEGASDKAAEEGASDKAADKDASSE